MKKFLFDLFTNHKDQFDASILYGHVFLIAALIYAFALKGVAVVSIFIALAGIGAVLLGLSGIVDFLIKITDK